MFAVTRALSLREVSAQVAGKLRWAFTALVWILVVLGVAFGVALVTIGLVGVISGRPEQMDILLIASSLPVAAATGALGWIALSIQPDGFWEFLG